jgi:hypothetical protein
MSRPQVANGGVGLQICRVARNISNKQSFTADKGVVHQLTGCLETNNSSPCMLLIFTQDIGPGLLSDSYELSNEISGSIKGLKFLDKPSDCQLCRNF